MTDILLSSVVFVIFLVSINIICMKSLKIPILSICVGLFTCIIALIMHDVAYFPLVNMIVGVFGVYCILSSILDVRKMT